MPSSSAWVVHISDLHLGGGHIPKAAGHDENALRALSVALHRQQKRKGQKGLIVTGDVSARGYHHQLAVFLTAWDHGWQYDVVNHLPAFRENYDQDLAVPGNHDFWKGWVLNGTLNPLTRPNYFPDPRPSPQILTDRFSLFTTKIQFWLHGICSTSGADPQEQRMAVGAFRQQDINALDQSIIDAGQQSSKGHVAHFVVTHHSPSHGDPNSRGIEPGSLQRFLQVCRTRKVCGILTGHAHSFKEVKIQNTPDMKEVRCSTTLERHLLQSSVASKIGVAWLVRRIGPSRELLVHELRETSGGFEWHCNRWVFAGNRFTPPPGNDPRMTRLVQKVQLP